MTDTTKGAVASLALYVPVDADRCTVLLAAGLSTVFGFKRVTNVAPTLLAGRRILLFGWRDYYDQAVGRYPPRSCWVVWPHGWAATEERANGAQLRHALSHLRAGEIGMFWSEIGDVVPEGAMRLPPVWPCANKPTAPSESTGRVVLSADASLAVVAGVLAAGGTPCIPAAAVTPNARDVRSVAKSDALRALLSTAPHQLYDGAQPNADLHVCLAPLDPWAYSTIDAIHSGVAVIASDAVIWTSRLCDDVYEACVIAPDKSSALVARAVAAMLEDGPTRIRVLAEQQRVVAELQPIHVSWAAQALRGAGFDLPDHAAPSPARRTKAVFFADTAGWAQHHFVAALGHEASGWDFDVEVLAGQSYQIPQGSIFYSPVQGMADAVAKQAAKHGTSTYASGGLWSHVSYGGWFTDDALDPARLPKARTHATNLYLHALTGLPYLAAGIDSDLFSPPSGVESRRARHARGDQSRRLVVGFTASLQYNAALKLFHDLWVPALRAAGSDGHLLEARFCARPLPVWDVLDARPQKDIARYLRGIDIYLCTSISEGCSLSVLEAASAGCAIISTPCGNAPELAVEIVGWDANEIAAILQRYERDRDLLYGAQEESRERAVRYWSWRSEIKRESWKAWLRGGEPPPWREQVPYCARGGFGPEDFLAKSRARREMARPSLVRNNMAGS